MQPNIISLGVTYLFVKKGKKNKVIFLDKVDFNFLPNAKILSCEHKNVGRTSLCNERISREESKYSPSWNSFHFFAIFHKEKRVVRNNKIECCMKNQNNFSFYRIII